jgi:ABC-type transport system involved in multi-copper enzyme maturation permease subunit
MGEPAAVAAGSFHPAANAAGSPIGAVLVESIPVAAPAGASLLHHVILPPQFYREGVLPARRPRPRPYGHALLWKELYVESVMPWRGAAHALGAVMLLCVLTGTGVVFLVGVISLLDAGAAAFSNGWARFVGTTTACALLLGVAVRAATSFSSERDRRTLDGLLTAPLENREILSAKCLGSILVMRRGLWALAAIWGLAMLTGGVHPLACPLLVAAWAVYAGFTACVGVWCSLVSRTTLRATIRTLLVLGGVNLLPWIFGLLWDLLAHLFGFKASGQRINDLLYDVACPPVTLSALTLSFAQFDESVLFNHALVGIGSAILGLVVYLLATVVLWHLINLRFPSLTGRMPLSERAHRLATDC